MRNVEWSVGRDADLMVDVWSTSALMEAVIAALLEHPEGLAKAKALFRGGP